MTALSPAMERRDAIDGVAAVLLIFLTLVWGINGVAIKVSAVGFSPVFMLLARSGVAAVLVYLWCLYRGIDLFGRDGSLLPGLLAGLLFGAEFVAIFFAYDYTTAARGTLLINTMPFWVLVGAHFLLGERMSPRKFVGVLLAFCGVALVLSDELSLPTPEAIKGDMLCLLAGLLWAATTLVIKGTRLRETGAEKLLLYQLTVSSLMALPLLTLAGPPLREVTALATASLAFQAVFVVAFTYVLWFWLMQRYPASGLATFTFLTPAFGVLGGGILLAEPLSLRIFTALALITIGIVVVNRPGRQPIEGQP